MATRIDPATVPGWGVDADPDNDPTWPMRDRRADDHANGPPPVPQAETGEVLQSTEFTRRPAVVGNGPEPRGLSGTLRRAAFRFSENDWWHWLLLLGADRVDMVEGIVADLGQGRLPDFAGESGLPAAWRHDRKGVLTRVAVVAAASAVAVAWARRDGRDDADRQGRARQRRLA